MRDKESTRQKILDAGQAEFIEKGYSEASLRSIATRAGVTTGAIYGHFTDKEALLEGIIGPMAQAFLLLRKEGHKTQDDRILGRMVDFMYDHKDVFGLWLKNRWCGNYMEVCMDQEIQVAKERMKDYHLDPRLIETVTTSYYMSLFEVIETEKTRKEALAYVQSLSQFYMGGWMHLMGA